MFLSVGSGKKHVYTMGRDNSTHNIELKKLAI